MRSKYHLALTKDKKEVVLDTDPRASSLLVGAGCEVPAGFEDEVKRFERSLAKDAPPVEIEVRDSYTREELETMKMGDLTAIASAKGIPWKVGMKKTEIVDAILDPR